MAVILVSRTRVGGRVDLGDQIFKVKTDLIKETPKRAFLLQSDHSDTATDLGHHIIGAIKR